MDPEQIAAMDPEGDFTKRHLLNPTVLQMLGDVSGRKVLDAGSGQGYFSRMLARLGATVTSMEPADALFRHSLRMEAHDPLGIEYVQEDLTSTSSARCPVPSRLISIARLAPMSTRSFRKVCSSRVLQSPA